MAPLGPWPPEGSITLVAIAVSGGADSTALAVLAGRWAARRGLRVLGLVVDHALRPASALEAAETVGRLAGIGIAARLLTLRGLDPGCGLAQRARTARYAALTAACRDAGAVDLLLGHHAGDQAETVLMRRRAGSGPDGLAGMAALVETDDLRLLRPLLRLPPSRLRATLARHGIGWVEDPSNHDRAAQRTRLRQELAAAGDHWPQTVARCGALRMAREREAAQQLAGSACLRPEGYALLPPALLPGAALAALIRSVGGRPHRPAADAVSALLARPRAATLAGTRLIPAGRLGPGWLLLREAAAIAPDYAAAPGMVWDGRFRLEAGRGSPDGLAGLRVGALGTRVRPGCRRPALPAAILATLPALRRDTVLLAVPHLGWAIDPHLSDVRFRFQPSLPASASALFLDH